VHILAVFAKLPPMENYRHCCGRAPSNGLSLYCTAEIHTNSNIKASSYCLSSCAHLSHGRQARKAHTAHSQASAALWFAEGQSRLDPCPEYL